VVVSALPLRETSSIFLLYVSFSFLPLDYYHDLQVQEDVHHHHHHHHHDLQVKEVH